MLTRLLQPIDGLGDRIFRTNDYLDADEELRAQQGRLAWWVLWLGIIGVTLLLVARELGPHERVSYTKPILILVIGIYAVGLSLLHKGHVKAASYIAVAGAWGASVTLPWQGHGISDVAVIAQITAIMIAGVLASPRLPLALAMLSLTSAWLMAASQHYGWVQFHSDPPLSAARDLTLIVCITASLPMLYARSLRHWREKMLTELHERKKAEEDRSRLLEAEKAARAQAEEANVAKDRFIAAVSHELRTPLTPVLMSITALQADPATPSDVRAELAMIRQNVEIEMRLIEDLLDLSRSRFGKLSLNRRPCRVHQVIEQAISTCAFDLGHKRLELVREFAADNPEISGDPDRLLQVFWNLLRNAIKFTPEGGTIRIRTQVQVSEQGPQVSAEVSDTGVGIDPALMPRLFSLFEQGQTPEVRRSGGLGVGLAVSRMIVEQHGGRIVASSKGPGQGATFSVTLPFGLLTPTADVDKQQTLHGLRVLYVEDHRPTALILAKVLRSLGHEVVMAASVAEARAAMGQEPPAHLLISDIGLPDGTGRDVMVAFARDVGHPGIAVSGYGTEQDIQASLAAGFGAHLVKPVSVAQLNQAIARVVTGTTPQPAVAGIS